MCPNGCHWKLAWVAKAEIPYMVEMQLQFVCHWLPMCTSSCYWTYQCFTVLSVTLELLMQFVHCCIADRYRAVYLDNGVVDHSGDIGVFKLTFDDC